MDQLLSEKEQLEALRAWWHDNGRFIISGILLGIALLVGWHYWQNREEQADLQASALFEALATQVGEVEVEAAAATAANLYENYGATVYASQARLAMAKLYMDVGRDQDAAEELKALLAEDDDPELQMVARLRLARILIYQDKPEEAVELVQGYRDSAFASRYFEVLGDAYIRLEKYDDAREAWSAALADNPQAPTVDRALIQMKLNDLPAVAANDADGAETAAGEPAPGDSTAPDDTAQDDPAAETDEQEP